MSKKEKVSIFSNPEEIDAVIIARLSRHPKRGGGGSGKDRNWTEDELELRRAVVWDYLTDQHLSKEKTAQQLAVRWDISMPSAREYVREAIRNLASQFREEEAEELKEKYIAQVEAVIQSACERGSYDAQLRGLEILGKTHGFFNTKTDVNLSGEATIKFDFN